jgi:hypothetical protein
VNENKRTFYLKKRNPTRMIGKIVVDKEAQTLTVDLVSTEIPLTEAEDIRDFISNSIYWMQESDE